MRKILIAKQNKSIIEKIIPKVKFHDNTENTIKFNVTEVKFQTLYSEVKLLGYNPYALMAW